MNAPKPGECCATCGRRMPKVKPAAEPATVDISTMTDAEVFAYRKKTAPREDVAFSLRPGVVPAVPAELRAEWIALLDAVPTLTRAEVYRRLQALKFRRADLLHARGELFRPWTKPPAPADDTAAADMAAAS